MSFRFTKVALCAAVAALLTQAASAATTDTTTKGNWIGTYGSDGYILNFYNGGGGGTYNGNNTPAQDVSSLPSYLSGYSYTDSVEGFVWENPSTSGAQRAP